MKKRVVREFLNLPEHCHGANVRTVVKQNADYSIEIHDCQNRVYLHGRFELNDDFKNALHKIDTLINALQETRKNIEEARQALLDKKAKTKETAKKKKTATQSVETEA